MIEQAYQEAPRLGLAVWGMDEAGPYQAIPQPGTQWQPLVSQLGTRTSTCATAPPNCSPCFIPAPARCGSRACGTVPMRCYTPGSNSSYSPFWPACHQRQWCPKLTTAPPGNAGRLGLTSKPTLSADLPPLRLLLIMDNLAGHKTRAFVEWLFAHGVMPLYTPLSGSWLNMTESVQRIIIHRALDGTAPTSPEDIMTWLEETAGGWNADPTPFVWGGPRHARRQRAYRRRHPLGGSGACTHAPFAAAQSLFQNAGSRAK